MRNFANCFWKVHFILHGLFTILVQLPVMLRQRLKFANFWNNDDDDDDDDADAGLL